MSPLPRAERTAGGDTEALPDRRPRRWTGCTPRGDAERRSLTRTGFRTDIRTDTHPGIIPDTHLDIIPDRSES